jgi:hypothetical protein
MAIILRCDENFITVIEDRHCLMRFNFSKVFFYGPDRCNLSLSSRKFSKYLNTGRPE